jgi:uncharacterized protein DUF6624
MNEKLAAEILRMTDEDQLMRRKMQTMHEELISVDARNTRRLREIVAEIGWPTRTKVGQQAEHLAWLLVQHADRDVAFQRECLALMEAESADEVCPKHLAYLVDRIRLAEGRPQRYGTQLRMGGQGLEPAPIEEPARVDDRRHGVGLEPIAEYVRRAKYPLG